MKKFLLLVLFLISSHAFSQSLSLFDVDASNFPTIRGKFYAFDAQGNQQRPNITDLSLRENGIPRTITNVSCPVPKNERLSVVLLVDVTRFNGLLNAKNVLTSWVDQLGLGTNEVALVSYESSTYIHQDFTTDKEKLLNSINNLTTLGYGEDHDGAITRPTTGGISIAEKGKYKKIVLLLSSCSHFSNYRTDEIISKANQSNVSLNFVIFDKFDHTPDLTQRMAKGTNGFSINKIPYNDLETAKSALSKIFQVAGGNEPCSIVWESGVNCKSEKTNLVLHSNSIDKSAFGSYVSDETTLMSFMYEPPLTRFESPIIGGSVSKDVKVTAKNSNFTISNIVSSNPLFTISPNSFTLQPNQSIILQVSYNSLDSGYEFSKFIFENNHCPQQFFVSGGFSGKPPSVSSLKLLHPNGREKFVAGSDTVIKWEGISESDVIKIEVSSDNAKSWNYIDTSKGNEYHWKNIDNTASDSCLIKITQFSNSNEDILHDIFTENSSGILATTFSPVENIIASGGFPYVVQLWNAETGKLIRELKNNSWLLALSFSSDGKFIAGANGDGNAKIWDVSTGDLIKTIKAQNTIIREICFTKDGKTLLTGSDDGTVKIWDLQSSQLIRNIQAYPQRHFITGLALNPQESLIVTGSSNGNNYELKIWEFSTGKLVKTLIGHLDEIRFVKFNPEGDKIYSGSRDQTIRIWDVNTWQELTTINDTRGYLTSINFSPDRSLYAVSYYQKLIEVRDRASNQVIKTFEGHKSHVTQISFSPDGTKLASGSYDNTVKVWNLFGEPIQSDQSDSVFSIVEPLGASTDIAMGEVLLSDSKDSVVIDFVRNVGSWNFDVRSVTFRGADAGAFSLVSGIPQYRVEPNSSHFGEFRFTPSRVGLHQAEVVIVTQSDTIVQTITGIGVDLKLQIHATFIDFGEVEVGNERTIIDTLVLKNVGSNPITIDDTKLLSPDVEQFVLLTGGGNFTLGVGEERLVTVQFKPKYIGRTSGRIGFEYAGIGSPAIAHLFGNGISGLVYIPNDSGYVGDRKSIQLMLGKMKPDVIASIVPNFKATLRLHNNHLAPINKNNVTMQNDSLYINLQGSIGTTALLAEIPVLVGLGNVDFSWIDIVDFAFLDASNNSVNYDFEKQNGSFKTLGICYEGGIRLINSTTPVPLLTVSPNPSDGKVEIEVNLIEDGVTSLKIYNSAGFLMEEMKFTSSGSRTIELDTKPYSNGLYFITIETPTQFDKTKLLLVK